MIRFHWKKTTTKRIGHRSWTGRISTSWLKELSRAQQGAETKKSKYCNTFTKTALSPMSSKQLPSLAYYSRWTKFKPCKAFCGDPPTAQISMFHRACYQVCCYRGLICFVRWGQHTSVDINIELWGQGVVFDEKGLNISSIYGSVVVCKAWHIVQ